MYASQLGILIHGRCTPSAEHGATRQLRAVPTGCDCNSATSLLSVTVTCDTPVTATVHSALVLHVACCAIQEKPLTVTALSR
jgi:hypothetical protein